MAATPAPRFFHVAAKLDDTTLAAALEDLVPIRRGEPAESEERQYLETFDGRLSGAGTCLWSRAGGSPRGVVWATLDGGQVWGRVEVEPPRFVWDLPAGPLRRRLEPILEMRALLPLLSLRQRTRCWEVLQNEGKVVARVRQIEAEARLPEGASWQRLPPRLELLPLKGYAKTAKMLATGLRQRLRLEPVALGQVEEALQGLGRGLPRYSSKVRVDLAGDLTIAEAVRRVLLDLWETLCANEAGTVADLDSEFLHDFRVAVRRTRTALSQMKKAVPDRARQQFLPEFAWLGALTGPTRDLDVYLLKLPEYLRTLGPEHREDLEPLAAFLRTRQRREQRKLARALGSERFRALRRDWQAALAADAEWTRAAPDQRKARRAASARIWKVYARALREGTVITPDTPHAALHELRKTCKKLRYLLEFFRSLFPAAEIDVLIKALKLLQDHLGDFNDLEVQAAHLVEFGEEMSQKKAPPAATLMAMGMLVEDLRRRQAETRREFEERFRQFADPATRARARRLFRTDKKE